MRSINILIVFILLPAVLYSQVNSIKKTAIRNGIVANIHEPVVKSSNKLPALIVLGGSEGGINSAERTGDSLCLHGFIVMSLAYFKMDSLPSALEEIPLEYFKKGIDYIKAYSGVDKNRIGIVGTSKGGEAALLVASVYPDDIKAVFSIVPSSVVWQSLNFASPVIKSSWTYEGMPMPYLKFSMPQKVTGNIADYYRGGLEKNNSDSGFIKVEKIKGPVFIVSGKMDKLWPSYEMGESIVRRLQKNNFGYSFKHVAYDSAGHSIGGPPLRQGIDISPLGRNGGSPENNLNARLTNWELLINFFKKNL